MNGKNSGPNGRAKRLALELIRSFMFSNQLSLIKVYPENTWCKAGLDRMGHTRGNLS